MSAIQNVPFLLWKWNVSAGTSNRLRRVELGQFYFFMRVQTNGRSTFGYVSPVIAGDFPFLRIVKTLGS